MVTNKIKELQALQARAAALQASIESDRNKELAALPAKFGFDSTAAFIQAVRNADRKTGGAGARKKKAGAKASAKPASGKRKRAVITPAIKAKVKAGVKAGTSGAEIAKSLGISLPSVHNIKKELGLVKSRKSKTRKARQ